MREKGRRLASSLFPLPFSLLILPALAAKAPDEGWTVLLSGDADGMLAPCGCTSPQQGGMKRRATALQGGERTVRLDNGGLAGGLSRQSVLKADAAALALALARTGVDAANLGAADARLGEGAAVRLAGLAGGRLVSTSLRPSETAPVVSWRAAGPFLVGGATSRPDVMTRALREETDPPQAAAHRLVAEAKARGLAPAMLFDGDLDAARALARAEPALRLVTYRSTGRPPSALLKEGACALATPGERGKAVVRLAWREDAFVSAAVQTLGPDVPDDPGATDLYRRYLRDVARERLLDEPRLHTSPKPFAGSARCLPCHADAARAWHASDHAHALATLERVGNDRDPECVPCHVVGASHRGLEPTMAFLSRRATPRLGAVGCESCHGPGAAHAAAPRLVELPKVGEPSCRPCHTLENSPNFDFARYWPKVRHGR